MKSNEILNEAVENAIFMSLDEWLKIKDTMDDNKQLNNWYKIWEQYYKLR